MAKKVVGPISSYLLLYNYDNLQNLTQIGKISPLPSIYLFHGDQDEVIPVEMSREMAEKLAKLLKYQEIHFAHHNDIFSLGGPLIANAMQN